MRHCSSEVRANAWAYFAHAIEPHPVSSDTPQGFSGPEEHMKIALLALLGLALGVLGGAALGIGAGLAWVEIFKTTSFEGYSGMLVFFTFMPLGAVIGGIGGALLFGIIAIRDAEIAIERRPAGSNDR
jgi:hypothetical protein